MSGITEKDAADLVTLVRRAPLQNMDEAQVVNALLEKFVDFFEAYQSGALFDDASDGSED